MAMDELFSLMNGGGQGGGLGSMDLFSIIDLLRQLYAAQQQGGGLQGAENSGGQMGGGARQLPAMPTPAGNSGGASNYGNTFDSAGNPLTFAGVTSPQTSMPGDRTGLIRSLAASTQPDQYGNVPWNAASPGSARISAIPDFSKPPQPGNMIDPRNWDPTQWVNHPEWHNEEVWRAYEQSQGAFNNRGPYTDPSGGSTLPFTSSQQQPLTNWHYDPARGMWGYDQAFNGSGQNLSQPGQYANTWSSLGFHNRADWKQAGRPQSLPQGTPLYSGIGGPYRGGSTAPAAGGSMGIGLPSVGGGPAWQTGGFSSKYDWKQAGRPGL